MSRTSSVISAAELRDILSNIYYLNMKELRDFCDAHGIPYAIYFATEDGRVGKSRDADRKGIVIDRVVHFLKTGVVKPRTVFPKSAVRMTPRRDRPTEDERIFYGQYKDSDPDFLESMKRLTDGKFEAGAISQEVIRGCWTRGEAPSHREFARLWLRAREEHLRPNPEWAFLTDRANGVAGADWKQVRIRKASAAIAVLKKIPAPGRTG